MEEALLMSCSMVHAQKVWNRGNHNRSKLASFSHRVEDRSCFRLTFCQRIHCILLDACMYVFSDG